MEIKRRYSAIGTEKLTLRTTATAGVPDMARTACTQRRTTRLRLQTKGCLK